VPDRTIELIYDPFTLSTAQHRAGLAGLLVLIESLRKRKAKPLPEVSTSQDQTISVRITEESLTVLFNDLYDATMGEAQSSTKRKDKSKRLIPSLREEKKLDPKTGKKKTVYIYPQVIPRGKFLETFGMPADWLKLWRDAIWGTLRGGSPQTRRPFEQRAAKEVLVETRDTWKVLNRFQQERAKDKIYTVSIASSIFIGAQAENAERVPFRGRADEVFLLHFWPVVMGVYVPEIIDREGKTDFAGYVLAVPDVLDMEGFVQGFQETIANLGNDVWKYRPKDAVISIPQEGGLEYLYHLIQLAKGKAEVGSYNVAGVEVYHLKPPNRQKGERLVRLVATDKVVGTRFLLENYKAIRDKYYSVLFRRQMILNLIRGKPWYKDFERVFAKSPKEGFIGPKAHKFSSDVRRRFEADSQARRFV
jgi:CRISPR-associated protein Cmx8